MCILITKEKGIRFPSERSIINSIANNPDGFAMAYNDCGEIITYKTLNSNKFIKEYRRVVKEHDYRDTAMVIHARIATHGTINEDNCHCWIADVLGCEMAFAHNGILPISPVGNMTDSETFLRYHIEPCDTMQSFLDEINFHIGNSKFAFLDESGNILRFGSFITEYGIQYSNRSYMQSNARCADPRLWKVSSAV